MNTPVNFEIAKLLKEKRFDIPTFYYYENKKLVEPYLENGSSTDTEFRVDLSDLKEYFNKWSKKISAPTIAEVVMWLYEKHEIWISVETSRIGRFNYRLFKKEKSKLITMPFTFEVINAGYDYKSPKEAYEAAIEYTLNQLI